MIFWSKQRENVIVNWPEQFEKVCVMWSALKTCLIWKRFFFTEAFLKIIIHILKCIGSKVNIAGKIQYSQIVEDWEEDEVWKTLWKKCHIKNILREQVYKIFLTYYAANQFGVFFEVE